ncbi:MAG TPA: SWIM zinc finger family protein [Candidatus Sulfopaludibacter sp.]|nr:SWIM zinc finger family protein [Candidatus Sulfopaludibacter sp.]
MAYNDWGWRPYVPVAERRRRAMRAMEQRRKKGHSVSPVVLEGRTIAKTFWGKSWCENLERYSDYANRLPRGRSYVRNGSVVDLQIAPGKITAMVSGSDLYEVELKIAPVSKARWKAICEDCAGGIDSLVELLQGRFSKGVMERICRQNQGLFPSPSEIKLDCSCPDWAGMCKHVAAVLYGIGARFDERPELLFRLREVDEKDLIAKAGTGIPLAKQGPSAGKVLGGEDLAEMFGLDLAQGVHGEDGVAMLAKPPAKKRAKVNSPAKVQRKRTRK